MADEVKQPEKKSMLPVIFKVVLGIVFLVLGVLSIRAWWYELLSLLKGCIGLFLILAGIITLAIAKE